MVTRTLVLCAALMGCRSQTSATDAGLLPAPAVVIPDKPLDATIHDVAIQHPKVSFQLSGDSLLWEAWVAGDQQHPRVEIKLDNGLNAAPTPGKPITNGSVWVVFDEGTDSSASVQSENPTSRVEVTKWELVPQPWTNAPSAEGFRMTRRIGKASGKIFVRALVRGKQTELAGRFEDAPVDYDLSKAEARAIGAL